jgi:hypothetical protein
VTDFTFSYVDGQSVFGNPGPQDLHVFEPPGSGSISRSIDLDPDPAPDPPFFLMNVWSGLKKCLQNKILTQNFRKNLIF